MKKLFRKFIIFTIFLCLSFLQVKAQPDFTDEVQDTPINSDIGVLILAGLIYGIIFIKKHNKLTCRPN